MAKKIFIINSQEIVYKTILQVLSLFNIELALINSYKEIADTSFLLLPSEIKTNKNIYDFEDLACFYRRKYPIVNYFLLFNNKFFGTNLVPPKESGMVIVSNLFQLLEQAVKIPPPNLDDKRISYLIKSSIDKEISLLCHDHKTKKEFCSELEALKNTKMSNEIPQLLEKLKKEYLNE